MKIKNTDLYFITALLSAIWFAATASAWTYLMNLFISLPAGILSYVLWNAGRKRDPKFRRYLVIPVIWGVGILISAVTLVYFLVYE